MNYKTTTFIILVVFIFCISNLSISKPNEIIQGENYKTLIFYVMEDSKGFLQIGNMDTDGQNKNILTKDKNNWCPTISPDGNKIAFYSDRSGFSNLWIMNIDGTEQKPLTNDQDNVISIDLYNRGQIVWTKDSNVIIFLKKSDIWTVDKTGETPSALTSVHDVNMFKLSPEGEKIIFSREKTKMHNGLWSMFTDGTNANQIIASDLLNPSFDWCDNNSIIYFNNKGICIYNLIDLSIKFIKETYYPYNDLVWNKSQNDIAYLSDKNNGPNIWITKNDGSTEQQISFNGGFSPTWFNDGNNIVFVQGSDIYKVNINSAKEAIRLTYYFKSYYPVLADIKTATPILEKAKN